MTARWAPVVVAADDTLFRRSGRRVHGQLRQLRLVRKAPGSTDPGKRAHVGAAAKWKCFRDVGPIDPPPGLSYPDRCAGLMQLSLLQPKCQRSEKDSNVRIRSQPTHDEQHRGLHAQGGGQ